MVMAHSGRATQRAGGLPFRRKGLVHDLWSRSALAVAAGFGDWHCGRLLQSVRVAWGLLPQLKLLTHPVHIHNTFLYQAMLGQTETLHSLC